MVEVFAELSTFFHALFSGDVGRSAARPFWTRASNTGYPLRSLLLEISATAGDDIGISSIKHSHRRAK